MGVCVHIHGDTCRECCRCLQCPGTLGGEGAAVPASRGAPGAPPWLCFRPLSTCASRQPRVPAVEAGLPCAPHHAVFAEPPGGCGLQEGRATFIVFFCVPSSETAQFLGAHSINIISPSLPGTSLGLDHFMRFWSLCCGLTWPTAGGCGQQRGPFFFAGMRAGASLAAHPKEGLLATPAIQAGGHHRVLAV